LANLEKVVEIWFLWMAHQPTKPAISWSPVSAFRLFLPKWPLLLQQRCHWASSCVEYWETLLFYFWVFLKCFSKQLTPCGLHELFRLLALTMRDCGSCRGHAIQITCFA